MTISPSELAILRPFYVTHPHECKRVSIAIFLIGSVALISGAIAYEASLHEFVLLTSIGGSSCIVTLITYGLLSHSQPKELFHTKKPLPASIVREIIATLAKEHHQKGKSSIKIYKIKKSYYIDYRINKRVLTAPLAHLLQTIPWKNIDVSIFKGGIENVGTYTTVYGHKIYNKFLRAAGDVNLEDVYNMGDMKELIFDKKRILYEVLSIAALLSHTKRIQQWDCPLLKRATNLEPSFLDKTHKIGAIISDPAFWSTSSKSFDEQFAKGKGIRVYYTISRSTSGVQLGELSTRQYEKEFLFPPLSRFKIISLNRQRSECHIDLEEALPA